jgi:hypothetical protein
MDDRISAFDILSLKSDRSVIISLDSVHPEMGNGFCVVKEGALVLNSLLGTDTHHLTLWGLNRALDVP